jgi:hypothetical protein
MKIKLSINMIIKKLKQFNDDKRKFIYILDKHLNDGACK